MLEKRIDTSSPTARLVVDMARRTGCVTPADLDSRRIPRSLLNRLCDQGLLRREGRGKYVPAGSAATDHSVLARVCELVPEGVVCLVSALQVHTLTNQGSDEVWVALDQETPHPRLHEPPVNVVRFTDDAYAAGIEEREVEGGKLRLYGAAKTIADCFHHRNKIGIELAVEALRRCRRDRLVTAAALWHFAKICKVTNVMKPYMETA